MIEATHHRRKEELSQVLSPNRIQSLRKNLPLRSPRSSCSEQAPSRRKMRALSERHTFCAVLQQYVNKYRTFLYSGGCRFTHFQGIFRAFFVKRTHIRKCVRPWKKPWKCPTLEIGLFPGLFSGFFRAFFGLFFDKNGCKERFFPKTKSKSGFFVRFSFSFFGTIRNGLRPILAGGKTDKKATKKQQFVDCFCLDLDALVQFLYNSGFCSTNYFCQNKTWVFVQI